jgi:hypothetical protein
MKGEEDAGDREVLWGEVAAGRKLIELAKFCYDADLPLLLEGRHGIGKSEMLAEAAAERNIKFISCDLSVLEPVDLVGLPWRDGQVTRYARPSFLPADKAGLFALEELNRCTQALRAPALQLLTARRLNDYVLPEWWLPVATVNPHDDAELEYQVDVLDVALSSRFVRVHVRPDASEWVDWARRPPRHRRPQACPARGAGIAPCRDEREVHPRVIAYVESTPGIFAKPESSPRSWSYVSKAVWTAERWGPAGRELLRIAVAGLVGRTLAQAFLKVLFDGGDEPLTVEEVLDYRRHRRRVQDWLKAGRTDLLRSSLHKVLAHLQYKPDYDLVRDDPVAWAGLGAFFGDLPGDWLEEAKEDFRERKYEFPAPPKPRRKGRKP